MIHAHTTYDYPANELGSLKPHGQSSAEHPQIIEGETVVNGVALPMQVIEELRKLGIALSWYNAGELRDAVEATHYDSQLIDDHNGVHFRDMLHHTEDEKEADEHNWFNYARMRLRARKRKTQPAANDCQHPHAFFDGRNCRESSLSF